MVSWQRATLILVLGLLPLFLSWSIPGGSAQDWPYIKETVSTAVSGDRLLVGVTLTNRFTVDLPDVMIHVAGPAGVTLADCWAGGGKGANPCSTARADNTAKWYNPLIRAGKTQGPFFAEFRVTTNNPDLGIVKVWWRWHGRNGGEALKQVALDNPLNPPTLEDVKAKFASLAEKDIAAMGYRKEPDCVDARVVPPPVRQMLGLPATAGMGFHAVNGALFDANIAALWPEDVLLDAAGKVWGVEYEATADTPLPVVLGQKMNLTPGHPGMEFPHYALHVWLVENPRGTFDDWNPNLRCP